MQLATSLCPLAVVVLLFLITVPRVHTGLAEARRRHWLIVLALGDQRGGTLDGDRRRSCGRGGRREVRSPGRTARVATPLNHLILPERTRSVVGVVLDLDCLNPGTLFGADSTREEADEEIVVATIVVLIPPSIVSTNADLEVLLAQEEGEPCAEICLAKQSIHRNGCENPDGTVVLVPLRAARLGDADVGVATIVAEGLSSRNVRDEAPERDVDGLGVGGVAGCPHEVAEDERLVPHEILHDDIVEIVCVGLKRLHLKLLGARDSHVLKNRDLGRVEERHFVGCCMM